jgi:cysteine desulfurase
MASHPVYLDCHATTPVDPRVVEAMLPYFNQMFGNAASINHLFGVEARQAVENSREQIAALLNTPARSLIFTSGATESNNLALKGILASAPAGSHLVVSAAEHRAVLDPAKKLERRGCELTILPVDRFGAVDPQSVADALRPNTVLVSVMLANNEVGSINPVQEIGEICRRRGVLLHTDAAQAVGRLPIDLTTLPVDLLSLSGHKLYAPKGIGVLFVRRDGPRIRIEPQIDGGGHEQHLRSGTLPVPLIVGLGTACDLARAEMDAEQTRLAALRDRLWQALCAKLDGLTLNGHPTSRLAGNLNVGIAGVDGAALMTGLTEIAASSGSACTSADPEPSHVLRAMGVGEALSKASLRFGLGRFNTAEEIDFAADHMAAVVSRLRRLSAP